MGHDVCAGSRRSSRSRRNCRQTHDALGAIRRNSRTAKSRKTNRARCGAASRNHGIDFAARCRIASRCVRACWAHRRGRRRAPGVAAERAAELSAHATALHADAVDHAAVGDDDHLASRSWSSSAFCFSAACCAGDRARHCPGRSAGRRARRAAWPGSVVGVGASTLVLFGVTVWTVVTLAAVSTPAARPRRPRSGGHRASMVVGGPLSGRRSVADFTTANEIHIPVGEPVRVKLAGVDVIHSFWVPALAGKTDLIPGQTNMTWLEARAPGVYRGQCTEYCGQQHAHMGLEVIAERAGRIRGVAGQSACRARTPATSEAATRRIRTLFVAQMRRLPRRPRHARRRHSRSRSQPSDDAHDHRRRNAAEHARLSVRLDRRSAAHQARQPDAAARPVRAGTGAHPALSAKA